jgi:hypothetical protein
VGKDKIKTWKQKQKMYSNSDNIMTDMMNINITINWFQGVLVQKSYILKLKVSLAVV